MAVPQIVKSSWSCGSCAVPRITANGKLARSAMSSSIPSDRLRIHSTAMFPATASLSPRPFQKVRAVPAGVRVLALCCNTPYHFPRHRGSQQSGGKTGQSDWALSIEIVSRRMVLGNSAELAALKEPSRLVEPGQNTGAYPSHTEKNQESLASSRSKPAIRFARCVSSATPEQLSLASEGWQTWAECRNSPSASPRCGYSPYVR
jgi:hypothetical protein